MTPEQTQTILVLITLAVAGYALYQSFRRGETITLTGAVEEIKEARPVAVELMEVVQIAVNSVEQLRREGKIADNDVAFRRALDISKKWIPDEWEIDNEDLINAINAAVLVASATSQMAGKSSESVTHGTHSGQPQ